MKILVTDGMDKNAISTLRAKGHEVIEQFYEIDQLNEIIKDVDVIIVRSATKLRKNTIDNALTTKRLKMIIRGGVGIDNIDYEYARSKGIIVNNTPKASSAAVAELALAHMFSIARYVGIANATMREKKWNKKEYKGIELNGKTLGLIGFGRIAKELAKRGHALGMEVIYNDILGENDQYKQYKYVTLDQLLKSSDFISMHIPADPSKGPFIDKEKIDKMKDGVYFINTSRGALVDEMALLDGLNSGKLNGAGLDVFMEEPTKNIKLINHPKVSVTPHIGASTKEAQKRIGEEIVSIIESMEE